MHILPLIIAPGIASGLAGQPDSTLTLRGRTWSAEIRRTDGTIASFARIDSATLLPCNTIAWRTDSMRGPAFCLGNLRSPAGSGKPLYRPYRLEPDGCGGWSAVADSLCLRLSYRAEEEALAVELSVSNLSSRPFEPEALRVLSGVDCAMLRYPQWDDASSPTLLRCEPSFAWGYFMTPTGSLLGFATDGPVASYQINYVYEGWTAWKWGHTITTASIDLLHCLPLPERHPQHLTTLAPGATLRRTLRFTAPSQLEAVKPGLTHAAGVPMIEAERYTLAPGEEARLSILTKGEASLRAVAPSGVTMPLDVDPYNKVAHYLPVEPGLHRLELTDRQSGMRAEASLFVREPWSFYMEAARRHVAAYPPIFSDACETFYGYYTAFAAMPLRPDAVIDSALIARFERTLPLIVDTLSWTPNPDALPHRIQNFSALMGMLVMLHEATADEHHLERASRIADYLCSPAIQGADGAYRSRGTHYTAVIYTAKSMLELVQAERRRAEATGSDLWRERAGRHFDSARRAVEDLALRLDDIQTEGDMTFEDGMISCSALQLGLYALLAADADPGASAQCTEAAQKLMLKHRCLEQRLVPDCRMRGATLRYWEVLDTYLTPNQAMSSPHGWTAWKIYAAYYLYLLTADVSYLHDFMDTLGACTQLMSSDGQLRWAFLPDPYIRARVCIADPLQPGEPAYTDSIMGEQYADMISPWLRPQAAADDRLCHFGESGGAGDNTVQEIFKALAECALTQAFVAVAPDGQITAYNCRARREAGRLIVEPSEAIVKTLHINSPLPEEVTAPEGVSIIRARRGNTRITP